MLTDTRPVYQYFFNNPPFSSFPFLSFFKFIFSPPDRLSEMYGCVRVRRGFEWSSATFSPSPLTLSLSHFRRYAQCVVSLEWWLYSLFIMQARHMLFFVGNCCVFKSSSAKREHILSEWIYDLINQWLNVHWPWSPLCLSRLHVLLILMYVKRPCETIL